jgi:hypothetical protein
MSTNSSKWPTIGSHTVVASLTPASTGHFVVDAAVVARGDSTLNSWSCTALVHSISNSFSATAPGVVATANADWATVATTGTVSVGPDSTIEVVCHNRLGTLVQAPTAGLTATRVSTVNGKAAGRPAHRRIANRFPPRLAQPR